jgi:hypothetical protein
MISGGGGAVATFNMTTFGSGNRAGSAGWLCMRNNGGVIKGNCPT